MIISPKPMDHAEFLARIRTVVRLRHTTAALRASETAIPAINPKSSPTPWA